MPSALVLTPYFTRQKLTYQMLNTKWTAIENWTADVYKTADFATAKTANKAILRGSSSEFAAGVATLDGITSAVATLPITGNTSITGTLAVSGTMNVTGMITASGGVTGTLTGDASLCIKKDGTRALTGNWNAGAQITATQFNGPLVGNVTGNCSGSSGSCTGNALTSSSCTGNATTASNCTGNSDTVDNYHAGNSSGNIPVSNGTVCANLNADMVDGKQIVDIRTLDEPCRIKKRASYGSTTTQNTVYDDLISYISSGYEYLCHGVFGVRTVMSIKYAVTGEVIYIYFDDGTTVSINNGSSTQIGSNLSMVF